MKLAEIKALTTAELQERIVAEEAAYTQKCVNHAVSPVDNPAEIRRMRRGIAQMKTILRERELNNN
ncbi:MULTISPECIES: 50S ribosomal protein L29 [unclassified Porphyromonas]|uniref:50S ribosomal protein L29 n=1 Tax=unclassified Porphyromonas TaxID=2645799 RepID=UPI00052E2AEE|nr:MULTISPECIES: 50S ribosomal protein L29 [unclassified Porphyromonas]KGN84405.1 50S ribosomal protein L29 [Porphyromonas sp. COT-290 OH860]KGO01733.1 50S ribosomal protein L29 [Porphyromonas sp. COT-290 OH3588]